MRWQKESEQWPTHILTVQLAFWPFNSRFDRSTHFLTFKRAWTENFFLNFSTLTFQLELWWNDETTKTTKITETTETTMLWNWASASINQTFTIFFQGRHLPSMLTFVMRCYGPMDRPMDIPSYCLMVLLLYDIAVQCAYTNKIVSLNLSWSVWIWISHVLLMFQERAGDSAKSASNKNR